MSSDFAVRTPPLVPRSTVDLGLPDLRWSEEPSDPLTPGRWGLYRDRISTRVTTLEWASGRLRVTVPSGASIEDCDLGLDIVRRAASAGGGRVDTDAGDLTLAEFEEVFGADWKRRQLEAAAGVVIHLARERGPIEMPGPTRSVWIGPRSVAELEKGDAAQRPDRLVRLMRRVLWPDPRYESAGKFTATTPDGDTITLAMLLPERPCVLPKTDHLALNDGHGVFLIPRSALGNLPVATTDLDDGNQLIEAIAAAAWPELCQRARAHQIDPK